MRPTADEVANTISRWSGVSMDRVRGRSCVSADVDARGVICWLLHQYAEMSFPEVAIFLNKKSHSTFVESYKRISTELEKLLAETTEAQKSPASAAERVLAAEKCRESAGEVV